MIRIVLIEAEGPAEVVRQALAQLGGGLFPPHQPEQTPAIQPAPPASRELRAKAHVKANGRAATPAANEYSATRDKIIATLTKRSMSSGDVVRETGLSKSSVCSMLHVLRKEGIIESRADENSIYPLQVLVKK